MAKKNSMAAAGGVLLLLSSLIYLYVLFSWYSAGGTFSTWLTAASFLTPFVAAVAIVGSITLFFMSIGTMAGKMADKMMMDILWKFIMVESIAAVIVTAGGSWFWAVIAAFVLSYLGGMVAMM